MLLIFNAISLHLRFMVNKFLLLDFREKVNANEIYVTFDYKGKQINFKKTENSEDSQRASA